MESSKDEERNMEKAEKDYFDKCVRSFRFYRRHAMMGVHKNVQDYKALPNRHKQMLSHYTTQLSDISRCIDSNYMFILHMLQDVDSIFTPGQDESDENSDETDNEIHWDDSKDKGVGLTQGDMDRVYTTLRQFVRDWSAEGREERDKCYAPIIDAVKQRYPDSNKVNILVPGAGLGRLAFDFASLGYNSEGNEFSIFMLIGSNYMLNNSDFEDCIELFPWCTQSTNHLTHADRIACVSVPDVDTTSLPENTVFGMCAGDFTEVYVNDKDRFDVVAASFFLDTAHNIIEYLEIIYTILKPGGHLISLGPLLFHYAGMPEQPSIELCWNDVVHVIEQVGFEIEEIKNVEDVPYINNPNSMINVLYKCKFIAARKPI